LVLRLSFVIEVSIFELVANINTQLELGVSFAEISTLDEAEDLLTVDLSAASLNDCVADFSDENNKTRRSIVVLRVVPDKQNGMHNWNEELGNIVQVLRWISKGVEQLFQSLEIFVVLVGFILGDVHFFLELGEWTGVCRFVLLQEFEDFLDSLGC